MTAEEWRPVVGWPDYSVSNTGRVLSHKRAEPYELVGQKHQGRRQVLLSAPGRRRRMAKVHVLVADAFLGPRPAGLEVCHNDGNALNNHVANLRHDTHQANVHDSLRHGTHPQASKTHCPASHPYDEINTRYTSTGRKCRTCESERRAADRAMRDYLASA